MKFQVVNKEGGRNVVYDDDPKMAAYQSAAYIQNVLGRHYSITADADGSYTVAGDGLMPITYVGEGEGF
jgi:hypothetical protein